jgi:hypothetical protein
MATVTVVYSTAIIPVGDSIAVGIPSVQQHNNCFEENKIEAVLVENNTAITL